MEFQANDNYLRGKRVVLLDIEGTTTPITFVKVVYMLFDSGHVVIAATPIRNYYCIL